MSSHCRSPPKSSIGPRAEASFDPVSSRLSRSRCCLGQWGFRSRRDPWNRVEATSTAAAHLTSTAPRRSCLIGGPFMSRALFVRGPPALACYLALLFRRHRRESPTFFAFCIHRLPPGKPRMGLCVQVGAGAPARVAVAARRGAFPAPLPRLSRRHRRQDPSDSAESEM